MVGAPRPPRRDSGAPAQANRVIALDTLARDVFVGVDWIFAAIATYVLAGQPGQAFEVMESSYRVPGMKAWFNWLFRSDSLFAPLWKNRRFEKLTAPQTK